MPAPKVLDAATGNEIFALGGTITPADHITYSRDGRFLATAHIGEAAAKVWDAATGKQLLTLYWRPVRCAERGFQSRWLAPRPCQQQRHPHLFIAYPRFGRIG